MTQHTPHPRRLSVSQPTTHDPESADVGLIYPSGQTSHDPATAIDSAPNYAHAALIHESQDEQFAAALPFVEQGLARGERCMYIVDETSQDDVLAALRAHCTDVDVDGALETGQLSLHTADETYLANGTFSVDSGLEMFQTAIDNALVEYDGFRVTAEATWVTRDDTPLDAFITYESRVNDLFESDNCAALCQYNRNQLPETVIDEALKTHPSIIYNGTHYQNSYYQPPDEYFGDTPPTSEVDRKLYTLADRAAARTKLREREQYIRQSYEITADPTLDFEEKLDALCDLGCDHFGLDLGALAKVNPSEDRFEVEYVSDEHEFFKPGLELPLSETYCTAATRNGTGSVDDPAADGYDECYVYNEFGIRAYLGTHLEIEGEDDRTFFFVSESSRDRRFSDDDHTIQRLMGQWVKYELNRQHREAFLRDSYEITADPTLDFEDKLERLLDLGRDRMDLEMGGITHLPSWSERFLNEYIVLGETVTTDDDAELWTNPGEDCYCRKTINSDGPVSMADVRGTDWEDDTTYRDRGLACYIGTQIMNGSDQYGTLWLGSQTPRDREFTDTEQTFIELMGQWVSYELEREHREQDLRDSNTRLRQFAYAASHDLQEPLRMVSTYLQLIENRYEDVLDDDGKEFLGFAVDGADRMRAMITGLLKYSRVQTDAEPLTPVDLTEVLDNTRADLQLTLEEHDATLTSDPLPRVRGDANQLRQVFQNLLENAITYSGDDSPRIHISANRRDQKYTIAVEDNGIGIDHADQNRVFDVFERGHNRDEGTGTGIGLALCKQIVDRHDGDIWLTSEPSEGTTVFLTLPAAQ